MLRQILLLIFFSNLQEQCLASSINDMVYYNFPAGNFHMCYRRLNSTNQVGCSTSEAGETGFAHFVDTKEDMSWVFEQRNGTQRFTVVLDIHSPQFKTDLDALLSLGRKLIAGVLINYTSPIDLDTPPFSPDSQSPNHAQSIHRLGPGTNWNPPGTNLLFTDLPFPIAIVTNSTDIDRLYDCYLRGNLDKEKMQSEVHCPYCAVNMRSVMVAAANSRICLRRNYMPLKRLFTQAICDPLGNPNLLSTLSPWPSTKGKKYILLVARMDGASLFDKVAPSVSSISSFVALYACMDILRRGREELKDKGREILFALFNGETYNYMGSNKLIHDLTLEPPYLDPFDGEFSEPDDAGEFLQNIGRQIKCVIELGHLIHPSDQSKQTPSGETPVYAHRTKAREGPCYSAITSSTDDNIYFMDGPLNELPPSSLHSFYQQTILTDLLYISNHEKEFIARFYNSFGDNEEQYGWYSNQNISDTEGPKETLTSAYIASTASAVSCGLYQVVTETRDCSSLPKADHSLVSSLLYCFSYNRSCSLFSDLLMTESSLIHKIFPGLGNNDVQVMQDYYHTDNTFLHQSLFARMLGDMMEEKECLKARKEHAEVDEKEKKKTRTSFRWQWLNNTKVCYKHHTYLHQVYSPTIRFDGSDTKIDKMQPAWAESSWGSDPFSIMIFFVPCWEQELKTLLVGVFVVVVTLLMILLAKYRILKDLTL